MKKIEDLLRHHPFIEGLEDDIVDLIAGCAKNVVYQANDYLFREGESADFFYLVRHGTVALEMFIPGKGPHTFLTAKSGEIVGSAWLIPPYRWTYDARAVELTRAIAFECKCLRDKCEADHHVCRPQMCMAKKPEQTPAPPPQAAPMTPTFLRIDRSVRETANVVTIEIPVEDNSMPLASFKPGQFNMLYAFGVGEVPISMSGDPAVTDRIVHSIRGVGAVSEALAALQSNDTVGVRGPFGSSWPVDEAEGSDVLVIAGGLGLAPLRPALYHLMKNRDRYGRVGLLYGTRHPDDLLFREELDAWRRAPDLQVRVTVDHASLDWIGDVGVVTKLLPKIRFDPIDTIAMICGPEVMMRMTALALEDIGVAPERIFVSLERNMKCAVGLCGHCQFGPQFVCKDGPIFRFDRIRDMLKVREI